MPKLYQVVAAAVVVTQAGVLGPTKSTMYQGAVITSDMTDVERDHLLGMGMIREIGGDDEVEAEVPASDPTSAPEPVVDEGGNPLAAPETDAERDAAKAKLPADGSAPPKNASQPVWVEYAVTTGRDYDACKGENRDVLIALTTSK